MQPAKPVLQKPAMLLRGEAKTHLGPSFWLPYQMTHLRLAIESGHAHLPVPVDTAVNTDLLP